MNNFNLYTPTKIVFGKGEENNVGEYLKPYGSKVLLHYGGGSVKRSGLYDRVVDSLNKAGMPFVELGGVVPNPRLSLVHEGVALCRKEKVDLILSIGGGSSLDSAKGIALGVPYDGDVWDFYDATLNPPVMPTTALPVASIITLPATGSEMSDASVLTNEEQVRKNGCGSDLIRPVLSILDPELCFTLPANQVANGIVDIFSHVMERYMAPNTHVDTTDRMCEAVMRAVISNGALLMKDLHNYDNWAEIMWAGSVAHNGILGVGRNQSWASHGLEVEASAVYDIPHGQGLAIIIPAWMRTVYQSDPTRFMQFAVRVMDVEMAFNDPDAIILEGIQRLENFFRSIGQPTHFSEIGINDEKFEEMAQVCDAEKGVPYDISIAAYRAAL